MLPKVCLAQATVNEGLETSFYWVDVTNGSDSNVGTQTQPFKTIGKAASVAQTNNQNSIGSKITINAGTYRESTINLEYNSKDTTYPITFEAATTGTVIVDGADVYSDWGTYGGNKSIYTHNWTLGSPVCAQVNGCPTANDIVQRQDMLFVNGAAMGEVSSIAAMQPGSFYVDTSAGTAYLWPPSGTNMSTATVEAPAKNTLFNIHKKQDIVVRGLVFQYANTCRASGAVQVWGKSKNILLDSDTFQWNNGQGLSITNPTTYFTVENSVAVHNGDSGFHADKTDFGLWQNDITSYNNWRGALGGYYNCNVSGAHFYGPHDDQLTTFTASYNQAFGLHWDTDDANISTTGVISTNNLLNGVFTENSQGPFTFSGAYICNQNSPIQGSAGMAFRNTAGVSLTNSVVMNNVGSQITFFGEPGGITFKTWDGGQTVTAIDESFTNTGNVIQGNVATQQLFQAPTLDAADWTTFQSTMNSNSNTWWNASSNFMYQLSTSVSGPAVDFATWQADTNQDSSSAFSQPSGNPGAACTLTPDYPDYWLNVDNFALTTNAAGQAIFNLNLPALNFTGTVNLTLDGFTGVTGLSGSLSSSAVSPNGSSVLTVSAGSTAKAGTYPVTVIGNNANLTHSVTVNVTVPVTSILLSTVNLDFGSQNVGFPSATQSVTVQNIGTTKVTITSIVPSGDYTETNTCGTSIKAGKSCTITVTFTPTAISTRAGSITITDSDPTSPQVVNLTGTGIAPAITMLPPNQTFPSQQVGTPSPAQTTTVTNVGTATLSITSITITGTNPGDFSQTNTCGSSVAAGASCTISIVFDPTVTGQRSASVTISDNTQEATDTISLSGNGYSLSATLTPSSLDFGNQTVGITSAPQTLTLTNTGTGSMIITNILLSGPSAKDFAQGNTCGTSLASGASCTISVTFTPAVSGNRTASLTVYDNSAGGSQSSSLSGTGVSSAPTASLTPSSLTYASQTVGSTSPPQVLTLSNTGSASLTISSIKLTGTNSGDYSQTNTCGSSLAGGASCTISVTFTPTTTGKRSASLTITDNTSIGSQSSSLTGTGSAAASATLLPSSLTFGNQNVGTTSQAQILILTNIGLSSLTISSIKLTGTNPGDYTQTNTCGSKLPVLASCTISVSFTPTASGTRAATVTVSDNTSAGSNTASLTGTGVAVPTATLTPTSLTFASQNVGTTSPAQTLTLTNTGISSLTINSIKLTGSNRADYAQTNTCGTSLAAGATCTISVTFTPLATGTRTATVTVTDNTSAGSNTASLTGSGVTNPTATLTPTSLTFAAQAVGTTSSSQKLTLSNTSSSTLNITSITITGTNGGDYGQNSTCGSSLAGGATCSISVTFTPTATGTRTATVTVTDNTSAGSNTASLTGTGVSNPTATLSPTSLTFASQQVGTTSSSQKITLTNTSTATLTISSIAISGSNAGDFAQTNGCGSSLAGGISCSINVTFTPTASGTRTATVTVWDNTTSGSQTASLSGTGAYPTISFSPTSLTFASQTVGTTSASQTITLTNTGSVALTINSISLTGTNHKDYAQTNHCGHSLAAGATCSVTVTFTPTAKGTRTASVSVSDNTSEGTDTVSLTGTGS